MKLFCLPYAGGSAQRIYRDWHRRLPAHVEVVPVELPGRGGRFSEPPHSRAESLLTDALGQIAPWRGGPVALFGHSMGAALAFELARRLERDYGCRPAHLLVSGASAPAVEPRVSPHGLTEADLREFVTRVSAAPPEVLADDELMAVVLPILRADLHAMSHWRPAPDPPVSCPLTVIGANGDDEVPVGALPQWRRCATGPFALHIVAGGHLVIDQSPELLLPIVRSALAAPVGVPVSG
ncbi:thioesterase II family protein [Actinoplanes sp. NPDC049599]|uniref:thioesterase II family protein n=1 Tax=Actinoplanes sp. NPDC049599 TaxID=3363903 RepID=UPI0037886670